MLARILDIAATAFVGAVFWLVTVEWLMGCGTPDGTCLLLPY